MQAFTANPTQQSESSKLSFKLLTEIVAHVAHCRIGIKKSFCLNTIYQDWNIYLRLSGICFNTLYHRINITLIFAVWRWWNRSTHFWEVTYFGTVKTRYIPRRTKRRACLLFPENMHTATLYFSEEEPGGLSSFEALSFFSASIFAICGAEML